MKTSTVIRVLFAVLLLSFLALPVSAQIIGTLTDSPQHLFAVGGGIGPSTKDFTIVGGFGERLDSKGTYSYTGVSIVPGFVTSPSGAKTLAITPVTHTGLKQILYQSGRTSIAIDGGAGVSLPSSGTSAFNFSTVGGLDFVWRLNKALNTLPGSTNNYLAIQPSFTQLTGTTGGTAVSIGLAWVHGVN